MLATVDEGKIKQRGGGTYGEKVEAATAAAHIPVRMKLPSSTQKIKIVRCEGGGHVRLPGSAPP